MEVEEGFVTLATAKGNQEQGEKTQCNSDSRQGGISRQGPKHQSHPASFLPVNRKSQRGRDL